MQSNAYVMPYRACSVQVGGAINVAHFSGKSSSFTFFLKNLKKDPHFFSELEQKRDVKCWQSEC